MGRNRMIGPIRFRLTTFVASVIQKKKRKKETISQPNLAQRQQTARLKAQRGHQSKIVTDQLFWNRALDSKPSTKKFKKMAPRAEQLLNQSLHSKQQIDSDCSLFRKGFPINPPAPLALLTFRLQGHWPVTHIPAR